MRQGVSGRGCGAGGSRAVGVKAAEFHDLACYGMPLYAEAMTLLWCWKGGSRRWWYETADGFRQEFCWLGAAGQDMGKGVVA